MTERRDLPGLPPRTHGDGPRASAIDAGRIRLCKDLVVSVNRSWQVDGPTPEPPAAEFKAAAPVVFWARGGPDAGDIYLAAIAAQDAWWLGFESKADPFAVVLDINGRNALTQGKPDGSLSSDPPNYLMVPDQPWFDAIRKSDGLFHQLVPEFAQSDEPRPGASARLTAFSLPQEALTRHPDRSPDEVQPLYGGDSADASAHRWPGRGLAGSVPPPGPCGRITVLIVPPAEFQAATGTELAAEDFTDTGEAPAPFDPFQ